MSARFPGLVPQDWRTRLVDDHPRLFPDARLSHAPDGPALTSTGWPDVPEGWRAIVETACRRLDAVVASEPAAEPGAEVVIDDMKEKYGSLRLTIWVGGLSAAGSAAAELAVDLAEARSGHVCEVCGARGRLARRGGWYATRCEVHADGYVPVRGAGMGVQVATRLVDGRPVRTARRYDVEGDRFVAMPVPDEEA